MWVIDIVNSFKKDTGVDIFKAIEEDWILIWMGFIQTEVELMDRLQSDLTYKNKIEELKNILLDRKDKKDFHINKSEVITAIKQSIQNSILWLTPYRKDFRYSEWLLSDSSIKNICQKYNNTLNPLYYMFKDDSSDILIKSVFDDVSLGLPAYGSKNWVDKKWKQRYRKMVQVAKPWMYYVLNAQKIHKSIYHPIIWYLLSNNRLENYIDEENRADIIKFTDSCIEKQSVMLRQKKITV